MRVAPSCHLLFCQDQPDTTHLRYSWEGILFSTSPLARVTAAASVTLALAAALGAAPASADPVVDMSWTVKTTTTLKKLDERVKLPNGTLDARIDMGTGKMTGNLSLPRATQRVNLPRLPLAEVTVAFEQAAPIKGQVDLTDGTAEATARFQVQIVAIRPVHAPAVNLVRGACTTAKPVTASLDGPISLGGTSTFESAYKMPAFKKCGRKVGGVVNSLLAGGKNEMTIKLS